MTVLEKYEKQLKFIEEHKRKDAVAEIKKAALLEAAKFTWISTVEQALTGLDYWYMVSSEGFGVKTSAHRPVVLEPRDNYTYVAVIFDTVNIGLALEAIDTLGEILANKDIALVKKEIV